MSIPLPLDLFTPIASNYLPQANILVAVTNDANAVCTTNTVHGYLTGYVVRITIPPAYGMTMAYVQTTIVVTGSTTFVTTIDTSNNAPFVVPTFTGNNPFTQAQVVPMTGIEANIAPTTGVMPPPKPPLPLPPPYFGPPVPNQHL